MPTEASTGNIEMQSGETNIAGRDISKGDSRDAELLRIAHGNSVILAKLETGQAEINKNMREIIDNILSRLRRVEIAVAILVIVVAYVLIRIFGG